MSKHYETVFILTPVLSEEQAKETVKKFKKTLTDLGAKVLSEEFWGLKKLAYPIDKKSTGFYQLFEYTTDNITLVNELEVAFKRDERVMRYMTIALDKHAIAYAEKRRAKRKGEDVTTERKPKKERTNA
ncbi:MAG: 30S ribosomal protein S6 [Bacteroidetes bacterium]|nr:30S ribosomal protein S6 [Bacteroidota bacterium]